MVRIYQESNIKSHSQVLLDDNAYNHVVRVLRMREGENLTIFSGNNEITLAKISKITKKELWVETFETEFESKESPLHIHLGQVLSRGEKMEFTIQKSVELGVSEITPLLSTRCGVKLDEDRLAKKHQQWQKIAQSACEQCGRNIIPVIHPVKKLDEWCAQLDDYLKLTLHPRATHGINQIEIKTSKVALLIGPEGGLTEQEIDMTTKYAFNEILLGPRILRTETVALTALTALQVKFGDLG